MKRTLALLITLAMLLQLAACGGGGALAPETEPETLIRATETATETGATGKHDATGFAVGFGREPITPGVGVPLAGFGSTYRRLSEKVLDELYATCIAVSDGESKLLFFTFDLSGCGEKIQTGLRASISRSTGVPEDRISFTATHTHSAPDINSTLESASVYYSAFCRAMTAAAKSALADLDSAEMSYGTVVTKDLNFVRRYLLADGTYSQNNSGKYPSPIVAHETDADGEMRILKFDRKNQKDIILANWQAHPTMTGSENKTDVSADLVGAFRKYAEQDLDVYFAYFQGAAGNLNPKSLIEGETKYTRYTDHGRALADALIEGLKGLTPVATGKIRGVHRLFTGTINHSEETPERIAQAQEVSAALQESYDAARQVAEKYNFANYISATSLLSRMKMGETQDMDLYAFAIGDFAFTTNPYEMFDTNGQELRARSPFAAVMNFGYSNGSFGYIPSAFAYPHRGYEGTTSRFVPGTGELVVAELADMLTELAARA